LTPLIGTVIAGARRRGMGGRVEPPRLQVGVIVENRIIPAHGSQKEPTRLSLIEWDEGTQSLILTERIINVGEDP
jgi:hypothetical protein